RLPPRARRRHRPRRPRLRARRGRARSGRVRGRRPAMTGAILRVRILHETDVVLARQRARQIAALLGLDAQDQTRFATAASELARNAFRYAGGGSIEFFLQDDTLLARVTDQGPGIPNLREILDGRYVSPTGM